MSHFLYASSYSNECEHSENVIEMKNTPVIWICYWAHYFTQCLSSQHICHSGPKEWYFSLDRKKSLNYCAGRENYFLQIWYPAKLEYSQIARKEWIKCLEKRKKTKQKTQTFFICVWKWVIRVTSFPLGWPWAFRSPGTWGPIGRSRSSGKPCPLWSTRHHYWLVCVIGVGDIMCSVWMYVMHALASVCVWERVCNFLFVSVSLISSVNRTQLCALKIRCEIPQTDSHYCFQNCMP